MCAPEKTAGTVVPGAAEGRGECRAGSGFWACRGVSVRTGGTAAASPLSSLGDAAGDTLLSGTLAVLDVPVADIERDETLRYLGHQGQDIRADLNDRLDAAMGHALAIARPRVAVRAFAVADRVVGDGSEPLIRLTGTVLELGGASIVRHLSGATLVVVMVVTVGMGIERELQRLSIAGDALGQLLFDAAATTVVERAADLVEAWVLDAALSQGNRATTRFSPGYGDLSLACQAPLLASVDAARRLGVTLTPSYLLMPTKSVTAVMGVGSLVRGERGRGCDSCDLRDRCTVRLAALRDA